MLALKSPVIKLFNVWTAPKIIAVIHTTRQIPNDAEIPWNNMPRNINSSLIPTIMVLMITIIRTLIDGRPVNKTSSDMKRRNRAGGHNKSKSHKLFEPFHPTRGHRFK
jgi:hypothetical protein